MHLTAYGWAGLLLAALLIGVSKTGLPGLGILAILLLANILPPRASTGLILPMLIVGDILAVAWYRRHAEWDKLWRLIPWAVAGVVIGYLALGRVSDRQLNPIIGGIVLLMLALGYIRNRLLGEEAQPPTHWSFAAVIGIAAGITTMMANAAGPIMIVYLLAMRLPKEQFIGTGAWYFLIVNVIKTPFSADLGLINPDSLRLNLMAAPMIVLGAVAGVWLAQRIPRRLFDVAVQLLAAAAALRLLMA